MLLTGLLLSGCVSKSDIRSMIEANNTDVIKPMIDANNDEVVKQMIKDNTEDVIMPRIEEMEDLQGEFKKLTDQQRKILVRHFEVLKELSENALAELSKTPL